MISRLAPAALFVLLLGISASAQVSPEQQAEMAINAARKLYNEGNLPAAREQFKQALAKFPNQQTAAARYGIALTFLNAPEPDYASAIEPLTQAAGDGGYAERGWVLYQLAAAQRMIGVKELAKPEGAKAAQPKFEDALRRFGESRDWFDAKKNDDMSVRCRCDVSEMLLRMNRTREVRQQLEQFVGQPNIAKNKHRLLALYYVGLACFVEKDYSNAGKFLNQIAPFTDPAIGLHARYLVGRVMHLGGETAEASVHYDTVLSDFEKQKKDAVELLKDANRFKNNPDEKARLQTLTANPPPDHVAGSAFHGATLNYEAGKFADALTKLQAFATAYPASPLLPEASLRIGFCQVQLKQFDEAVKLLAPMVEKFPKLADQTLYWLAKAQVGIATASDPAKPDEQAAKFKTSIETFKKAAEKAKAVEAQDPEARQRRGDILLDLGDTLHLVKSHKDAAATFEAVWNERLLPDRRHEEVIQRLAAGWGSANDLNRSEQWCNEFKQRFPQSTLMPAVLFRVAENAYARAVEIREPNRAAERKQRLDEAAKKYQEVVDRFPEFERVNYARFGIGVCLSQNGDLEAAAKILEAIPGPDRLGELSAASYLLADCLIRLAPTKADDALAENIIREKLTNASGLLENFVASNPKSTDAPDALMKLGLCLKRLGSTLADANERNTLLNKAREFFEKLEKEYPKSPQASHARLEIAKVRALAGDRGGAMNDLRQFANGDRANSPVAPLAYIHLATLHREQNQPAEAAKVMEEARKKFEQALAQDKERAEWALMLKYHHGIALFESVKMPESKQLFDEVVGAARGKPIGAEAALRAGQSSIAIAKKQIETAKQDAAKPNLNPQQKAAAEQALGKAREAMYQACAVLEQRYNEFAQAMPTGEPRARMMYDAAWAYRSLAEDEVNQALTWANQDAMRKWTEEVAKPRPEGVKPPPQPTSMSATKLQLQRAEERTLNSYQRIIQDFPELAIAVEARFEAAELHAEREKYENAITLLKDALDKEPTDRAVSSDLLERIRLRLGGCLFAKGDFKNAATQFETVAGNEKSPHRPQAIYRHGEALFSLNDFEKATARLMIFRDKGEYHNIGNISDRAVLRLGQSLAAAKNWEESRKTFETMVNRYGNSTFLPEARYGFGWSLQNQSKFDEAIAQYQLVINATTAEVAARAQTQIGLCKLAQKKFSEASAALMLVPYTYDYPQIGYAAVLEAARAYEEDKKPEQAERILSKLLKDAPANSDWSKAAKERLEKLKK